MKKTVVVGISGGVDSSIAAHLLKKEGYNVIGMFMKNWEEKTAQGNCTSTVDYDDAATVCEQIGIPLYTVNFAEEYRERVFTDFLEGYKAGETPNPDILCNREIKFDLFFKKALDMGADYLATGHYCRKGDGNRLLRGVDSNKDQSYFLYTIKSEILDKVLFPVGELDKGEVRRIAAELGLATATKKDSMGICFIGKRNFREFLGQFLTCQAGKICTLDGKVVGEHQGIAYYTLGQRKGLGIGGQGDAWFVVDKDVERNRLIVVQGEGHPALYGSALIAKEVTWVSGALDCDHEKVSVDNPVRCTAKIRYRHADVGCRLVKIDGERVWVEFDEPQKAITPRQSVVFYDGEVCLGGGLIESSTGIISSNGRVGNSALSAVG
jgi:tRNA-specific 2-thiouridylase